jgi:hypothetical protein
MQPLLSSRRLDVLHRILSTPISSNLSLVAIRDRSRQVGELFGLDNLQRMRFITAISDFSGQQSGWDSYVALASAEGLYEVS